MRFDHCGELFVVASRRMQDARELLESPSLERRRRNADYRHLSAAYYLAGYAVECILKAYTILWYNMREERRVERWAQVVDLAEASVGVDLKGAESHNLEKLLRVSELEDPARQWSEPVAASWGTCSMWRHDVRYTLRPIPGKREDELGAPVAQFVDACDVVYRWVKRRMP